MATVLSIIIFISYISLGIPDSLFGAAWPAIYSELSLPVSYANFITVIHATGTIISSLMSAFVIKKLGTARVTFLSALITSLALLGFSLSDNIIWLCLSAVPLGLGAGSIDTALNNYVAINYSATQMSFLHTSYGLGVTISPYLLSLAMSSGNWHDGYRTMFYIQFSIAMLVLITLPVWKKVRQNKDATETKQETISIPKALAIPKFKPTLTVFFASVALEAICLVWSCTYLVETKGVTEEKGAECVTFYFLGMTVGRFLSGVVSKKLSPKQIIIIGECITFIAVTMLILSPGLTLSVVGFFLIGFGNGPLFPNMTHLAPIHFGEKLSQATIGIQMAVSSVSVLVSPIVFGYLAENIGTHLFPWSLMAMVIVTAVATALLFRKAKETSDTIAF